MRPYKIAFFKWLPMGVVIVGLCGLIYVAVQQDYRSSLNDPQIQIAEDMARTLSKPDTDATKIIPPYATDVSKSLMPFIAAYNAKGVLLASSGVVNGNPPTPPAGVFEVAHTKGENRVTWEPAKGTRIALVVVSVSKDGGFVIAGRNMREVEEREVMLMYLCLAVAFALTLLTLALEFFGVWRKAHYPALTDSAPAEKDENDMAEPPLEAYSEEVIELDDNEKEEGLKSRM